MNKSNKKQLFELEKFVHHLKNNSNPKVIAIAGKINNKKTKLINSVFKYVSEGETKYSNNITSFNQFLLEKSQKNKRKNKINKKKEINNYFNKGVYYNNIDFIQTSIGDSLRENIKIENIYQRRFFKFFFKIINKLKIKFVLKKLNNIEKHSKKSESYKKIKVVFPTLTTITTIGTSIGSPLLSILLLRNDEIVKLFTEKGYIAMVFFCSFLIFLGIISIIFFLFLTIFSTRNEFISKNLVDSYKKFLLKNFILKFQDKHKVKFWKRKILITKNSNYYFDEFWDDQKNYKDNMDLFMVHNAIGNNVVFTITIKEISELKNIFNDSWGSSLNYSIFNVAKYKNPYNKENIINFILESISQDTKIDFINLYKKNYFFKKYLDEFYDLSDNNVQIMDLLNIFKKSSIFKLEKNYIKKNIDFFIEVFYLYFLNALNSYEFDLQINSLITNFRLNDFYLSSNTLNLGYFFTNNLEKFEKNALIFNLNNLGFNNVEIEDFKNNDIDVEKCIKFFLSKNEFNFKEKNLYINIHKDLLEIIKIDCKEILKSNKTNNIFEYIEKYKNNIDHKNIKFLLLNFGYEIILLQKNLNDYQVLALNSVEFKSVRII